MKQIQPFQKHWLQITSIVVCRLNGSFIHTNTCIYVKVKVIRCSHSTLNTLSTEVMYTNIFNLIEVLFQRWDHLTSILQNM